MVEAGDARRMRRTARAAILGSASLMALWAGTAVAQTDTTEIGEVVVTATRQAETLSKVPISVSVLTQEQMDAQGVKEFKDIVRLTPSLSLNPGFGGGNDVSIRGVSSQAGAATTGIYIDDTPLQVRQTGYAAGTVFPVVFDLARVEVLRGPQGTLFGAGSEGGTIRFIQRQPDLREASGYARVEGSQTAHSASNYEVGAAYGGPIVQDKIGFRASAYFRRDGGYIDRVPGTFTLLDPTGEAFDQSFSFTPTGKGDRNANSQESVALRGAVTFEPNEAISITPSVFYQRQKQNDGVSTFWPGMSDRHDGRFAVPMFTAGPATPGGLTPLTLPQDQSAKTELFLPSLNFRAELGFATFYSTTSYLEQTKRYYDDQTMYYAVFSLGDTPFPRPGAKAQNIYADDQKQFTQELRLQSSNPDSRLRWVVGAYFSRSKQLSHQFSENNVWASSSTWFGFPVPADGSPFGPGFSSYQNTWGTPLLGPSGTYVADAVSTDKQIAGFGQVDFKVTDRLSVIVGGRVSRNTFDYVLVSAGPENNLNIPFGAECPTGPVCPFGSGVFAPAFPSGTVSNKETSITPKVGVNFQATADDLFYATASKGFRPGGGQIQLPAGCAQDLLDFGYVDSSGRPASPPTFKSDSVWSYEVGAKNRLLDGKLRVASSAYLIKWRNIQQNLQLPGCGYSFVDNLGSATIKGFDVNIEARPVPQLSLGLAVGYTHTELDDGVYQPSGAAILTKGGPILNAGAPWTVTLSGQYDFAPDSEYDPYIRADYTYTGQLRRTGRTDPGTFNFDPFIPVQNDTHMVNARLGAQVRGMNVSLFVNNVFDAAPYLRLDRPAFLPYIYTTSTFRPRTIGITAARDF